MANSAIQSAQFGVATEAQRGVVNGTDARNLVFGGAALGFRNKIINGDMRISQRYDQTTAQTITTGSLFYTVDRFFVFAAGANITGQRIAGTGSYPYVYRVTGAASNTQALLIQRIEASNIEHLASKTITLQFEASATGITSLDYDIRYASVRDNFNTTASITSGTVTVSTSPTIFTVTVALPANAANGIQVNLGKTSGLVASQTFSISGVQLESGSVATPFENRPIGAELALCQRYYWQIQGVFEYPGIVYSPGSAILPLKHPVSMRGTPVIGHGFTDANYVTTLPTGSQWTLMASGTAYSAKTGTVTFSPLNLTPDMSSMRFLSATFSQVPNALEMGPNLSITISAEL